MAQVPVSKEQLDQIVEIVARDLLEIWALNDRFTVEQIEEARQNAVDDTVFVVENFMSLFNDLMLTEASNKKLI